MCSHFPGFEHGLSALFRQTLAFLLQINILNVQERKVYLLG